HGAEATNGGGADPVCPRRSEGHLLAVEGSRETEERQRAQHEPEVAQRDVVIARVGEQVDDDAAEPEGDQRGAEARPDGDDQARGSPEHDAAIGELHALLLKAARYEVRRRGAPDAEDLARQAADDALMAILRKLGDFRGESRFTTWAYKFALYEAAVAVRRRAWQGRELPLETEAWQRFADARSGPAHDAETKDLLAAIREEIES